MLEKHGGGGSAEVIDSRDMDERMHQVERQIADVEGDNRTLREKLDGTNGSVGQFIREMSTLLD